MPQLIHTQQPLPRRRSTSPWVVILLLLGFTVCFLYAGITRLNQQRELDQQGRAAIGTVTDLTQDTYKGVKSYVEYTYAVQQQVYTSKDKVNGGFYRDTRRGATIPITYSAVHPNLSRTEGSLDNSDAKLFCGLGCFSLILGLVLLFVPEKYLVKS